MLTTNEIKRFRGALAAGNYSQATSFVYQKKLSAFIQYNGGQIDDLTAADVNDYLTTISSTSGRIQSAAAIKAYFYLCLNTTIRTARISRNESEPRSLSKDEIGRFLASCDTPESKAIFSTIYYLGLRQSELINLQVSDIRPDVVIIRDSKTGSRRLPLPDFLSDLLTDHITTNKPVGQLFNTNRHELRWEFIRILKLARITTPATLHSLRHSAAFHLYADGNDIISIKNFLGHKSLDSTMVYTKQAYCAKVNQLKQIEV